MSIFEWIAEHGEPPPQWDLRRIGWTLTARQTAGVPCLVDMRGRPARFANAVLAGQADGGRCIFLGVAGARLRAGLLAAGSGDALASGVGLVELAQRARRVVSARESLPRERRIGPVVLDLLHRDARVGRRWLALHPREFALLWRLAQDPGEPVTRALLLREVWRREHAPATNSVEVHVSRLRGKLAAAGVRDLVETDPRGGYRLAADPAARPGLPPPPERQLCAPPIC